MARDRWQFLQRHPRFSDSLLAVASFVLAVSISTLGTDAEAPRIIYPVSPVVVVVAALASVALLWHREHPAGVLVTTTACGVVLSGLGHDLSAPLVSPVLVAVYSVGWRSGARQAHYLPPIAGIVLLSAAVVMTPGEWLAPGRVTLVAGFLLAGAFAEVTRSRQNYLAAMQARAELAERTRDEEARHRVAEERVRIARELHDIVAHHMALAHAQASTAAYLLDTNPAQVQQLLDQLSGTTSSALRELKATVGLLREDNDPNAPLEPAPGLARLPDLLESFDHMGLSVAMSTTGSSRPLSPGVDLTAYRIVQEALTNVIKHAGTTSATVELVYTAPLLRITVRDSGPGPAKETTPGYGLIGMKERALSVGGELLAGRRQGGGFEVSTKLPLAQIEPCRDHTESEQR